MRGRTEHGFLSSLAALLAMLMTLPSTVPVVWAANHREAPITALDHKADITDWFAFVSYDDPTKVTLILDVDPLPSWRMDPTISRSIRRSCMR